MSTKMGWPVSKHIPALPQAKPAIDPSLLDRLKMAGDLIHAKLEDMPKKIAREYARGLRQIADMIEKLSKLGT